MLGSGAPLQRHYHAPPTVFLVELELFRLSAVVDPRKAGEPGRPSFPFSTQLTLNSLSTTTPSSLQVGLFQHGRFLYAVSRGQPPRLQLTGHVGGQTHLLEGRTLVAILIAAIRNYRGRGVPRAEETSQSECPWNRGWLYPPSSPFPCRASTLRRIQQPPSGRRDGKCWLWCKNLIF